MKTDDLIRALAVDGQSVPPSLANIVFTRLLPGVAIAVAIYFATLGVRPQLLQLLESDPRVFFKFGLSFLLLCLAVPLTLKLAKPGAPLRGIVLELLIVPALLVAAVVFELFTFPEADWLSRLMGHNALICMGSIPLLALGPLCGLFAALRYGAPSRPAMSGAAAGLLAGAIGAALYATHCPDDSPLFVATWYSLAIAIMTTLGAVTGARLLRW